MLAQLKLPECENDVDGLILQVRRGSPTGGKEKLILIFKSHLNYFQARNYIYKWRPQTAIFTENSSAIMFKSQLPIKYFTLPCYVWHIISYQSVTLLTDSEMQILFAMNHGNGSHRKIGRQCPLCFSETAVYLVQGSKRVDISTLLKNTDINIDRDNLENIDIDIDIDTTILKYIDIAMDIDKDNLGNIDINIDIYKDILGKKIICFNRF